MSEKRMRSSTSTFNKAWPGLVPTVAAENPGDKAALSRSRQQESFQPHGKADKAAITGGLRADTVFVANVQPDYTVLVFESSQIAKC